MLMARPQNHFEKAAEIKRTALREQASKLQTSSSVDHYNREDLCEKIKMIILMIEYSRRQGRESFPVNL
jgi:hypothetical protein